MFHASDHIQESSEPIPPEDQRDFRFTLRSYSTTNDAAPPQCFEFAATNQAEYDFWTNFQVSLWVSTLSFGAQAMVTCCVPRAYIFL